MKTTTKTYRVDAPVPFGWKIVGTYTTEADARTAAAAIIGAVVLQKFRGRFSII